MQPQLGCCPFLPAAEHLVSRCKTPSSPRPPVLLQAAGRLIHGQVVIPSPVCARRVRTAPTPPSQSGCAHCRSLPRQVPPPPVPTGLVACCFRCRRTRPPFFIHVFFYVCLLRVFGYLLLIPVRAFASDNWMMRSDPPATENKVSTGLKSKGHIRTGDQSIKERKQKKTGSCV